MRLLTIILFLITISLLNAQWKLQNPSPTGNTTYVGSAPSADRFITVTGQGEAVLTHDGGQTWNIVQIGGDGIYRSTYFLNDNLGWAVGSFVERLHKTTDGGLTWTWQQNAPDTTKYDVFFIDSNIGWSIGFNGFIIKTTDGGDNWFSQTNTSISTQTLYGVYATDVNNVFVTGNNDALLRSTNGGSNWTLTPPIFGTSTSYRGVYFPPTGTGLIGYAVGNRDRITKTTDGGASWFSSYDGGGTNQLWAIDFDSSNLIGLAVGATSRVLRTTDGGTSWISITGFPSASITFYSVRFGADNAAYLSGSSGYMFKSTDGGATWNTLGYRFTNSRIRDVSFADNNTGYVVGTGFVAKSTDGGNTWTEQTAPFAGDINEVVAPSPDFAVAGCDAGNIIRTTDGGNNWALIATGISGTNSDILAFDFIDNDIGLVAAYNGTVAKTIDGGLTWTIISTIVGSNPWDMDMVDSLHAWVAGTGERIFGTTDGGMTWNQQLAVGGLGTYGISFIDSNRGVAGGTGGNTYYTTNGGQTWNSAVTPPGNTVWGIHIAPSPVYGSVALTACASGYVYKSIDGGMNWVLEPRYTISTMDDVFMTDAANAWFVGNSGLILKYTEPDNIPVELSSFSATVNSNNVMLKWITATELNNKGFEIERNTPLNTLSRGENGVVWKNIGFVNGKGTTTESSFYSFTDIGLKPGKYNYRIKQIDFNGTFKYYNLAETVEINSPNKFELSQNYPNPFNPRTTIRFQLPTKANVTLKIFDVLGSELETLLNQELDEGYHKIDFDAGEISSGIYFYQLSTSGGASNFIETKKMILIR